MGTLLGWETARCLSKKEKRTGNESVCEEKKGILCHSQKAPLLGPGMVMHLVVRILHDCYNDSYLACWFSAGNEGMTPATNPLSLGSFPKPCWTNTREIGDHRPNRRNLDRSSNYLLAILGVAVTLRSPANRLNSRWPWTKMFRSNFHHPPPTTAFWTVLWILNIETKLLWGGGCWLEAKSFKFGRMMEFDNGNRKRTRDSFIILPKPVSSLQSAQGCSLRALHEPKLVAPKAPGSYSACLIQLEEIFREPCNTVDSP